MRQGTTEKRRDLCLRQGYISIQENPVPSLPLQHRAQHFNTILGLQPLTADAQIETPGICYRPPVEAAFGRTLK